MRALRPSGRTLTMPGRPSASSMAAEPGQRLEPRESRLFAGLHPPEESLERPVNPPQRAAANVDVQRGPFGVVGANLRELLRLVVEG